MLLIRKQSQKLVDVKAEIEWSCSYLSKKAVAHFNVIVFPILFCCIAIKLKGPTGRQNMRSYCTDITYSGNWKRLRLS